MFSMSERDDELNFARNLAALRERRGLSQSELARRMVERGFDSYSQMTVSRTEKGQRPVRLGEARALAEILGSRVDDMTRGPATEEIIEEIDHTTKVLANAMGSAAGALTDYALEVGQAADLASRHADHAEAGVRDAAGSLRLHLLPIAAVVKWAADVATTQALEREDFQITVGDLMRMHEIAKEEQMGEIERGERQAEV